MKIKFLTALTLLLLFTSCSFLMSRVLFGIKPLDLETATTIQRYERKVGYDPVNNNYYVDSTQIEYIWKGMFPKAFIYNSHGKVVRFLDCFATGPDDLNAFFGNTTVPKREINDTVLHVMGKDTIVQVAPPLAWFEQQLRGFDGNHFQKDSSDYYVVYCWSKAFGRINRKFGVKMEKAIKSHKEWNARFVKVNCDFRKGWGFSKEDIN